MTPQTLIFEANRYFGVARPAIQAIVGIHLLAKDGIAATCQTLFQLEYRILNWRREWLIDTELKTNSGVSDEPVSVQSVITKLELGVRLGRGL